MLNPPAPVKASADQDPLVARFRACCARKGWNLGQLARHAGVSRQTLYQLERGVTRKPRFSTLGKIATALDVTPEHLIGIERPQSVDFARTHDFSSRVGIDETTVDRSHEESPAQRDFDRRTNGAVANVVDESPQLFTGWNADEWDELYSSFGTGGPLTPEGVVETAARMNRKRETIRKLHVVMETHLGELASGIVDVFYGMIRCESQDTDQPPA